MPQYDFKSLSSYDFECLVRDLLQKELDITLESFKAGKDEGIDLRYSVDGKKSLIIQCKHYATTGYKGLLGKLRKEELPKIEKLEPARYVIATSVPLSPSQKEGIKKTFSPFCKNTGDVYGCDDLNNLLGKFPEIERQNFKLWLTSQPVLEHILHSDIYNQTEAKVQRIKQELKYYVQNESFFEAEAVLKESHYCIICGIPGIGKTMLANILLIKHIDNNYEAVTISSDISEAFTLLKSSVPQVFYYDDFLGQTTFDQKFSKNEEQKLLDFIDMVRKSKNKRFILTTREYILNRAKAVYEKLDRSNFDVDKCTIQLNNYTQFERAKILFNHVYFSNLPEPFKHELLHDNNYMKIVQHRNYNPRIIEWMADFQNSEYIEPTSYISEFLSNLENPSRIWQHAFDNQLSEPAKHVLLVLASLPDRVFIKDLKSAFDVFYKHASEAYGFARHSRDFRLSLKELESNFLTISRVEASKGRDLTIQFNNPSVQDFLDNYLLANKEQISNILESACFFEQSSDLSAYVTQDRTGGMTNQLLNALRRTIESETCVLVNYSEPQTKRHYVGRSRVHFEARVVVALKMVKDCQCDVSQRIFDGIITILIRRLEQGSANKTALLNLIELLAEDAFNHVTDRARFLEVVSMFFRKDLDCVDDYSCLLKYNDCMLTSFPDAEFDKLRSGFHKICKEEVEFNLSDDDTDPEFIREFANLLRFVADHFDIDVLDSLDELEWWANELEERSYEPDYDDEDRYTSAYSDDPLEAIEELFNTLLD